VHHLPRRPATGRAFSGEYDDPRQAPEHWSASHFHEDDLEDAAWPRTFSLQVPAELPSGVYAAHVVAGAAEDRIPFFVRPPRGCPGASVAVLFPTVSYLSYANERMQHKEFVHENGVLGQEIVPDAGDLLLSAHPELGSSLYDRHLDGDGVCLSSAHRPILNMRDSHRNWQTHAPRAFSADLYLEHWLDHEDIGHDVLTDHDLQAEGRALLDPYQVLITGSHPEYWTARMWDALSGWLAAGGRLMYLGGNGFYWVTSFDPTRPHVIEIQRGVCGIRCWESAAGEMHHVTTGEPGGLWRNRRLPVSQRSELAWAFDGIDEEEVIGDFGLAMGGAAGDEIDRHDVRYGSPPEAVVVATSQGAHSDYYMLVCEDIPVTHPNIGGQTCPDVRADIVLMPTAEGGAVFSTGSMAWTASLSWENYANNVARLTGSVLRRFLDPEPLKLELKSNDESRFVNTNTNSQGNP
jgi:N,N-dimethylformamidase